jgi:hypothetical protein
MNAILFAVMLIAAGAVMMRCIDLVSVLSHKTWHGHWIEFFGFSFSIALTAGGAMGILLGLNTAPILFMVGVAGWILFDRRM